MEDVFLLVVRYLQNEMSEEERKIFEQKLNNSAELRNELTLHQNMKKAITLSKSENIQKVNDIRTSLQNAAAKYEAEQQEKKILIPNWVRYAMSAAASVLFFVGIWWLLQTTPQNADYARFHPTLDLQEGTLGTNTDVSIPEIKKLYKEKKYEEVIQKLQGSKPADLSAEMTQALAFAYIEKKEYTKAEKALQEWQQKLGKDGAVAEWYRINYIYLSQHKVTEAKEALKIFITKPSPFQKDAQELWNVLEKK